MNTRQRKHVILEDKDAHFKIVSNPDADGSKPWYAFDRYSEVKSNERVIEREAEKAGINSDMVKAIVHLETTQGAYDKVTFGYESSIRPMNIKAKYWKELGFSRKDLRDPEKNIQAGVKLLKRIAERVPNATVDRVATIYHSLGARRVSDYGARVKKLTKEKPWKR